ncbi:hypothetical protein NDU88_007114, partial [Pleurodeles waltl]
CRLVMLLPSACLSRCSPVHVSHAAPQCRLLTLLPVQASHAAPCACFSHCSL